MSLAMPPREVVMLGMVGYGETGNLYDWVLTRLQEDGYNSWVKSLGKGMEQQDT